MIAQPFSLGLNAREKETVATGQKRSAIGGVGVLIVDPHPFFRLGLLSMLRSVTPTPRLREAESVAVALSALRQESFDLVLLDIGLLQDASSPLAEDFCAAGAPQVIAFAEAPGTTPQALEPTLKAVAVFSRTESAQRVRVAVEAVLGTRAIDRTFAPPAPNLDGGAQACLTERQREVHQLMLKGLPNKEIARRLGLSPNTVKVHMTIIFKKLGIASRYQALAPFHTV